MRARARARARRDGQRRVRGSVEELTPTRGDVRAALPPAVVALATLVAPRAWRYFSGTSAGAYAVTPAGWAEIVARAPRIAAAVRSNRSRPTSLLLPLLRARPQDSVMQASNRN